MVMYLWVIVRGQPFDFWPRMVMYLWVHDTTSISRKVRLRESNVFEVKGEEETAEPLGVADTEIPQTPFQPHYLKRVCFSEES